MVDKLSYIMDIGEQMLISGAEVHRVEDSVGRMCSALGAKRTDVFIITSNMIVTIIDSDGENHTETRRITVSSTNIERLHRLNSLSRKICSDKPEAEEIKEDIKRIIEETSPYPTYAEIIACALIAGCFTLFFGGGIAEALISFAVGSLVKLLIILMDRVFVNKIFEKFICSFFACSAAFIAVKIGIVPLIDKIVIGNIMSLIPGIGLTNSLRDLFIGDSIAGVLRLIEALLTALAITGGYFLFVCTLGGI